MSCIYGLYDSAGNLRYVGKANDAARRLRGHLREARRRRSPLYDWIRKHGAPEMRILEAHCVDWREAEKRCIRDARARGERLLNIAEGGDQPYCPPEVRARNGRMLVQRIRSDGTFRQIWHRKRQLAQGLRDGLVSNKTRAKMRLAAKLKPELFGCWAGIRDRDEDGNGEPIGGYDRIKGGRCGAPLQANS